MSDYGDDILDGLEGDSAPTIPIRPAQATVAPASGSSRPGPASHPGVWTLTIPRPRLKLSSLRTALEVLTVLLLIGWFASSHLTAPLPAPIVHHETGTLYAELVHDAEKDGKATGPLKADATLAPRLKELDCGWGWIESADPRAVVMLKGQTPPAVAIVRKGETEAIKVIPVPENGDPIVAAVKALRGKN